MKTLLPTAPSGVVLDASTHRVRAIAPAFALAANDVPHDAAPMKKPHLDKRRDHFRADVMKRSDRPLSPKQKQALLFDLRSGYKCAVKGGEDRDFDTWRAFVIGDETREHRGGQVHGLREAREVHFKAIRARAFEESGKHLEAYELRLIDTPEGERRAFLVFKVRELLAKLPARVEGEDAATTQAMRDAYGDTLCQRMFRCRVINADVGQLDKLYRELKPAVTQAANERRAAAHAAAAMESVMIEELDEDAQPF